MQLWTRDGAAWQLVNDAWHERGVRLGERSGYELAEQLFGDWTENVRSGDGSALTGLYAEDALVLVEGQDPEQGRAAVRELWPADGIAGDVRWDMDEVHAEGRMALITGRFRVNDSEAAAQDGAFLQLWVRSDDEWRVYRESWPHGLPARER